MSVNYLLLSLNLVGELCLLQESMQAINMCLQVEEPLTTVQYPYQKPPPAPARGQSRGIREGGQRTLPHSSGGSPNIQKKNASGQDNVRQPSQEYNPSRRSPGGSNRGEEIASRSPTPQ